MSVSTLVSRMDTIRYQAEVERYGEDWVLQSEKALPYPRIADLASTFAFSNLAESHQRRLVDAAFRFLLQVDMLLVCGEITNSVVYGPGYTENRWSSPSHWMRSAVLSQYEIVASRIALECFFDLIYIADRNERMPGDSKFKEFRKWIVRDSNPYKYFVGHIIQGFEFDRQHRQQEVHGTSRFAQCLLRLQIPDTNELNVSNQLTNVLIGVWHPFVELFDGKQPAGIAVFENLKDFPFEYFQSQDDPNSFDQFIVELLANRLKK